MFSRIFPFSIHVVRGHSMQPFLNEGDRVVVFRWAYIFSRPKVGDVVVFRHSDRNEYIKRISAAAEKNEFVVAGDNKRDSMDSRKHGHVQRKAVIGKVIMKY